MDHVSDFFIELEGRRVEIVQLKQTLLVKEAELRGMEAAARFVPNISAATPKLAQDVPFTNFLSTGEATPLSRISKQWRDILTIVGKCYPGTSSLADIQEEALALGHDVEGNTLRAQMAGYAQVGFLKRHGAGHYALTLAGAKAIGFALPNPLAVGPKVSGEDSVISPGGSAGPSVGDSPQAPA